MIERPRTKLPHVRRPNDDETPCAVCDKPINITKHKLFVWVHEGGASIVTEAEGKKLNETGHRGSDLGLHPVGRDCIRRYPELEPYVVGVKD